MERYRSLNRYLRERFGRKVYKLAVDGGFTCPNRDGTLGYGGCIFCSEQGSGDFAAHGGDIRAQLEQARARVGAKTPAGCGYICYFQSYTNTYAPVERLRGLFYPAIEPEDVVALSVGTRPDCIDGERAALLGEINRIKPVFAELGLQTSNEQTARLINRCYTNSAFTESVRMLRGEGVEVVVHIILGLPGETERDMLDTVDFVCGHDIQGIKLQLLHVLRGTALAGMDYAPLEMEEYFRLVGLCLGRIPPDIVIHRLTGDGDKRTLIAPLWSADKHRVLNGLARYLDEQDIVQGAARQTL